MKAIIQRVTQASVTVDGKVVGEIGTGFMILLGAAQGDTDTDCEKLADKISTQVISWIPRDNIVQECEMKNKTVVEGAPDSAQAKVYDDLASKIIANTNMVIPTPLDDEGFDLMIKQPLMMD